MSGISNIILSIFLYPLTNAGFSEILSYKVCVCVGGVVKEIGEQILKVPPPPKKL